MTVTLSNGAVINIDAGKTTGSVNVPTLANDVYNNGSTVSASITSATGGNFENLVPNPAPAVTTIIDSIDNTGITLTASDTITEGNQITYTATLTNPAQTPVTVTLSNGAVINIDAGKTTASVVVDAPKDDVYLDAGKVQATITKATGGNFESLIIEKTPASTSVTDTLDPTNLSLTATGSVAEGGLITYTASLSNPAGTAMNVTLSNGAVIHIDAGKTSGSVNVAAPKDDVYLDASQVSTKIASSTGGNFENLIINGTPVVTYITDTINTSTVTLTATTNVNEGHAVVYTATVTAPVTGSPVIVTLANGETITIAVGQTTGTVTINAPNDALIGHAPLINSIVTLSGGNYEKLVADSTPVSTKVTDTVDTTTLSLSASASVEEGSNITYTATLTNPASTAMTVTLSNGAVITIDAGSTSGSVNCVAPKDDVYLDASNVQATLSTATGGNLESLSIDRTPAITSVTDTIDTTRVSLTANTSVTEGGQITYTATLSNPAGTAVTVTLSNGAVISIDAGKISGSVAIETPKDDVYLDATQVQQTITKAVGGNFENLVIDNTPAVTSIIDSLDTSTVKLFATTNVNEGGTVTYTASVSSPVTGSPVIVTLANHQTITIPVGESTASTTILATNDAVTGHAPLTNAITSVSGGNYENLVPDTTPVNTNVLDTVDMTQLTLSATPSVAEGGKIVYTANLTNPAGTAMTVTLSNGAHVTIDAGNSSGSVTADAPKDDVYLDAGKVQATIETATGGNFENLVIDNTPASTLVTDTLNATQLSLSASNTVAEGGQITYTASLSNEAGTPVGITLSNGAVIYIDAGKSTGSVVVDAPKDDVYLDGGKAQATIIAATGGNFENLVTLDTPAITDVTDTIDTSTVKLNATQNADGSVTYSASVTAPVTGSAVIITLASGQIITIAVGESSAGTTLSADEYALIDHTNAITSVIGGNYENLVADKTPASAGDATHLTLSATNSVAEGGQITYTATLTNATGSAMSVSLSNGAVITIDAGKTTGSVVIDAPKDDVYLDAGKVQAAITTTTGGDFTNLITDHTPAATNVTDTLDTTNLSLTATDSVAEGGQITYTAALTHPAGTAMNVTLSNGAVIHIDSGQTTGTIVVNAPNNDAYLDASQVQATIMAATGGNFENLVTSSAPAVTAIADSLDTSTVKLTATENVNEDGTVTYTASVTSPVTDSAVIVTLANGQTITIPVGQSTGSVTTTASNDLLLGHPELVNSITFVSGGNYENLVADMNPVSTTVIDTVDTTRLSLTANASVDEGGQITYTATLSNPADTAVTVTLSNGAVINIGAGTTSGSVNVTAPQGDVYLDDTKISANITEATGDHFENLTVDHTPVITNVTDSIATANATTLSLSASDSATEGGQITYTATLSNPAGTPMAVTLSNGAVISIDAGKTTGSVIFPAPKNDGYIDAGPVQATITTTTGGNFESLVTSSTPAVTNVTDTLDTSTVKLTASDNVNEGGTVTYTASVTSPVTASPVIVTLANGQTITIGVGESFASITATAPKDALIGHAPLTNSITNVSGGNYESLIADKTPVSTSVTDIVDVTKLTLSATNSVAEGGQITYTATLTNPAGTAMTVTLSNGAVINIDAGSASGSVNIAAPKEDVYLDAGKVQATITTTTGGNFENLVTDKTMVSTSVTDTIDTTILSLTASDSVVEGGPITYIATLTNPAGTAMDVTLSNGAVVHIDAGHTSGTASFAAPNDVYLGAGSVNAHISSTNGGNFESLFTDSTPVTTSVTDKIDKTEASITGSTSITEGEVASYTVSLTHAAQTEVTLNITYSGTANDGSDFSGVYTVKIPAGASSTSFNVVTIDDKIIEGTENLVVKIDSISGGNFENLAVSATNSSVSTLILDNDAPPALNLDANDSSGAGSANYNVTFTEGPPGQGVSIGDTDLNISDPDSTLLTGATIVLTNSQPGDVLNLGASVEGISINTNSQDGAITLTLSGEATLAGYMQQIKNITFTNTLEDPSTTPRTITVSVSDGDHHSDIATTTVNILSADLKFDGISGDGYQALQTFVAQQTGADVSTLTTHDVYQYANENYTSVVISGPNGASQLIGGEGNDILLAQGGNHLLDGNNGNDLLLGGTGSDTLSGGAGNDFLGGGAGADSFVWAAGDKGHDVIKDFNVTAGDRLDLHDLLQGESGSTIDNFLKITTVDNVSTLQVSSEGKLNAVGGVANADVTIKLDGNNWSHASINSLIAGSDPTIKIDHSNS
nr:immunoglobulin-like domain-containing protein [Pseudomonas fluorescens]